TAVGDLRPGVLAVGCLAALRRRVRKDEREDLLPVQREASRGDIDRGSRHRLGARPRFVVCAVDVAVAGLLARAIVVWSLSRCGRAASGQPELAWAVSDDLCVAGAGAA